MLITTTLLSCWSFRCSRTRYDLASCACCSSISSHSVSPVSGKVVSSRQTTVEHQALYNAMAGGWGCVHITYPNQSHPMWKLSTFRACICCSCHSSMAYSISSGEVFVHSVLISTYYRTEAELYSWYSTVHMSPSRNIFFIYLVQTKWILILRKSEGTRKSGAWPQLSSDLWYVLIIRFQTHMKPLQLICTSSFTELSINN